MIAVDIYSNAPDFGEQPTWRTQTRPVNTLSTSELTALRADELKQPRVRRALVARIDQLLAEHEAENARATAADWAAWHSQDQ